MYIEVYLGSPANPDSQNGNDREGFNPIVLKRAEAECRMQNAEAEAEADTDAALLPPLPTPAVANEALYRLHNTMRSCPST